MKPYGIKYLVSYDLATHGMPEDTAGTLYVVNKLTGNVFWFDNNNMEWFKSMYSAEILLELINAEFIEVESFDNGYVNTEDIWEGIGYTSLIDRHPEDFVNNIKQQSTKEL